MKLKLLSYNVDGLPDKLDLYDLPWIFRPLVWIYELIKGTHIIVVNDNTNRIEDFKNIGNFLKSSGSDIIDVQEDFNFHNELVKALPDYNCGTHQGGFDLSKIFSKVRWFPYPRYKADGLNLFAKKNLIIQNEEIVRWKDSYGYFSHGNDKLTFKGFRHYTITIKKGLSIEVYIVHMDADYYHPEKCPDVSGDIEARKSQLLQLSDHIIKANYTNPIVVIGDTNLCPNYSWDEELIKNWFIEYINLHVTGLKAEEVIPEGFKDVDRCFIINNPRSTFKIDVDNSYAFYFETVGYSDHKPLMVNLEIENRK